MKFSDAHVPICETYRMSMESGWFGFGYTRTLVCVYLVLNKQIGSILSYVNKIAR